MSYLKSYLEHLADAARPSNDRAYGSRRQVAAENDFFDALDLYLSGKLTEEERAGFDEYCLKATTDERLTEGLRLATIAAGR